MNEQFENAFVPIFVILFEITMDLTSCQINGSPFSILINSGRSVPISIVSPCMTWLPMPSTTFGIVVSVRFDELKETGRLLRILSNPFFFKREGAIKRGIPTHCYK